MKVRALCIAGRRIGDDSPPFLISEIGSNHGGSLETAKQMIAVAARCGVDAVKLQKRDNRNLYTAAMYDEPYNSEHAYGATYGEHRAALEFGWNEYVELQTLAKSLGVIFFATAFDIPSATFLANLGVPAIKIASGDLTNHPLLEHCAGLGLPLIVSTGGHDITDIVRTVDFLQKLAVQFALLQATALYPCPHEALNLRVIEDYRRRFPDVVIGLSDHQDGISMAPVAWMLGARIFEKHFTLSRAAKGSDNAFSLEPEPMRRMVNDLHGVRAALGDGVKRMFVSEQAAIRKMGKTLVAARDLPAGHVLSRDDIAIKSPWGPVPPYRLDSYIGRKLLAEIKTDEQINSIILAPQEAKCDYISRR